MHVTVLDVERCQICQGFICGLVYWIYKCQVCQGFICMLLYWMYKGAKFARVLHACYSNDVERCQVCHCFICLLLYWMQNGANCAWGFYACYGTGFRTVPNVPGFYIRVTVLDVERCQVCQGFVCVLLYWMQNGAKCALVALYCRRVLILLGCPHKHFMQ